MLHSGSKIAKPTGVHFRTCVSVVVDALQQDFGRLAKTSRECCAKKRHIVVSERTIGDPAIEIECRLAVSYDSTNPRPEQLGNPQVKLIILWAEYNPV
ncbi:hypothetical protein FOBRF1_002243 [Fusarium oxysporum]